MTEEQIEQKAEEYSEAFIEKGVAKASYAKGYIAGATENGIQIHNLRKNPNDLPECDESKHITFYVEEWIESIQKYRKHYCLGFYKKSFMISV